MPNEPLRQDPLEESCFRDRIEDWALGAHQRQPRWFAKCCLIAGMLIGALCGFLTEDLTVESFFVSALSAAFLGYLGYLFGWGCEASFPGLIALIVVLFNPRSTRRTLAAIIAVAMIGGLIQVWIHEPTLFNFVVSTFVYATLMLIVSEVVLSSRRRFKKGSIYAGDIHEPRREKKGTGPYIVK